MKCLLTLKKTNVFKVSLEMSSQPPWLFHIGSYSLLSGVAGETASKSRRVRRQRKGTKHTHLVTLTLGDTSFLLGRAKSFGSPYPVIVSRPLPECQAAACAVLAIFPYCFWDLLSSLKGTAHQEALPRATSTGSSRLKAKDAC